MKGEKAVRAMRRKDRQVTDPERIRAAGFQIVDIGEDGI